MYKVILECLKEYFGLEDLEERQTRVTRDGLEDLAHNVFMSIKDQAELDYEWKHNRG